MTTKPIEIKCLKQTTVGVIQSETRPRLGWFPDTGATRSPPRVDVEKMTETHFAVTLVLPRSGGAIVDELTPAQAEELGMLLIKAADRARNRQV